MSINEGEFRARETLEQEGLIPVSDYLVQRGFRLQDQEGQFWNFIGDHGMVAEIGGGTLYVGLPSTNIVDFQTPTLNPLQYQRERVTFSLRLNQNEATVYHFHEMWDPDDCLNVDNGYDSATKISVMPEDIHGFDFDLEKNIFKIRGSENLARNCIQSTTRTGLHLHDDYSSTGLTTFPNLELPQLEGNRFKIRFDLAAEDRPSELVALLNLSSHTTNPQI